MIVTAPLCIAQPSFTSLEDDPDQPWHISADQISYDQQAELYIASGNVRITKADRRLNADYVRFDHRNMVAEASGNVLLIAGGDILTGSHMLMDLNSEIGTVNDGTVFLKQNHFYIKGDKIEKIGPSTYRILRGSLSSCDDSPPAWKITGDNLKVTLEGYGYVTNAKLWAKKVPVLYSPLVVFPAKSERQSGFLAPEFAHSDRKGFEYLQPYFWAISESMDATFYAHLMGKRGVKGGLEYRYVLEDESSGAMMFDYLYDRKVDDGVGDNSRLYGYTDDNFLRTNRNRYWYRIKADQRLPARVNSKLDLDIVSDQDYLKEFRLLSNGFEDSNDFFTEAFGRDLDDYDDTERVNRLNLQRLWPRYSLNVEVRWIDNVLARRFDVRNTSVNRLPTIDFEASKQPVAQSPFFFDLESQYTYFYVDDRDSAQRFDLHPRLYYPWRYRSYFTFEPSLGVRQTAYYIDSFDASTDDGDRFKTRELFDLKLDSFSEFYNVFPFGVGGFDRIKHELRPQVIYDFIPHVVQGGLPRFDRIDRIDRKNLITYSLTNNFTLRKPAAKVDNESASSEDIANAGYSYHPICRLDLKQAYNIREQRAEKDNQFVDEQNKRPFTPLAGRLDVRMGRYLTLQADADWSTYETTFFTRNIAVNLKDLRGDSLFIEHRFSKNSKYLDPETSDKVRRNNSESFYTDVSFKLTDRLALYSAYEYDLQDKGTKLKAFGARYSSQCWSFGLTYREEDAEQQYIFLINLLGLGQAGKAFKQRSLSSPLQPY